MNHSNERSRLMAQPAILAHFPLAGFGIDVNWGLSTRVAVRFR